MLSYSSIKNGVLLLASLTAIARAFNDPRIEVMLPMNITQTDKNARNLQATCGNGNVGSGACSNWECCSEWGWCGTTSQHCTGTCGNGNRGNGRCSNGHCCSQFGWCGDSPAHCSSSPVAPPVSPPVAQPVSSPVAQPVSQPVAPPVSTGTGTFRDSTPLTLCEFSSATAGSSPSSKCTGATIKRWLSFSSFGNKQGYFAFTPSASGASAYLQFNTCYDGRGHNSIALVLYVVQPTTLTVDVGVASNCNAKTGSVSSTPFSIAATGGWQTVDIPIHFFTNQDLSKMYTIGFTGATGKEIRVRSIKLTKKAFISRSRHELFEWNGGNRKVYRFSSFNAADLIGRNDVGQDGLLDPYEQEDLIISAKQMGGRVVRTYTLRVKAPNENAPTKAIQGLRKYGTAQFVALDRALQYANKHGIRLIIPFIDNWNWYGGIDEFNAFRNIYDHDAFFYDSNLRQDFKNLITDVIWRVNSITGVRYRDDPAILAWELGNELCSNNNRNDPPASWVQEMVDHIRSQDPNHLTMDGTWSNSANYGNDWSSGMKAIANLDIVSAHYYGGESSSDAKNYVNRMYSNQVNAYNAGKVFIVGEYGIANASILATLLDAMKTSGWTMGALIWSVRSQSVNGGALVHSEYAGYVAYQWPGYNDGPKCGGLFSSENYQVMNSLYSSAVAIAGAQNEAPPCTHRGDILQLGYNSNANVPSIYADGGCIQTLSHSGFSSSYRTVDLRVRQATGAFTNIIQYSFDGSKFKTIGQVDMTVREGKFLASHRVPVTSSGTTRTIHYRVVGSLRNSKYLAPTTVKSVSVAGVDPAFYNAWVSAQADTFTFTNCY